MPPRTRRAPRRTDLPAGAEGTCEFDTPLSFLKVSLSAELLAEVSRRRDAC